MPRLKTAIIFTTCVAAVSAAPILAQQIVAPPPGEDPNAGCLVRGLDPNGDGFLALRAEPGTKHAIIGKLRNGDAAYLARNCQNRWCYVENGAINGKEAKFRGYIYDAWCEFYP